MRYASGSSLEVELEVWDVILNNFPTVRDVAQFTTCVDSGKYKNKVAEQFEEARSAGGEGTPHNIIIGPDGKALPLPGSRAYATVKEIIDALLSGG